MLCVCQYSSLYTTFWYSKLNSILQSPLEISQAGCQVKYLALDCFYKESFVYNIRNQIA